MSGEFELSDPRQERETASNACTDAKLLDTEILTEVGNIGAGHAATSLSFILQEKIDIDVPKTHILPTHLVAKFYERHDKPTTAIYMQLNDDSECDVLLLFEREEAEKIATMMTMTGSPGNVCPEMQASAILELGNIVIGSFLSAISDFTGIKLIPSPPQLSIDCFDALIDSFLVKQSLLSDVAIIFDTKLKRADGTAGCNLLLFPSKQMQKVLIEKANRWVSSD
jgi:chemotaxis protein CheC